MTVVEFPAGIDVAGKNALWAVPAIANVNAPTLTELNAGFPIQCALYEWVPKGEQPTVSEDRYCLAEQIESLGKTKFTVDPLKYVYDPQNVDEVDGEYCHYAKLAPGTKVYLVDRRGVPHETDFAADQIVDLYPVTLGIRNRTPIDSGTKDTAQKYTVEQSVAVSGPPKFDVKITAGA